MDAWTDGQVWPISWERAAAHTRALGQLSDAVVSDHRLAAHRVLDQWAAMAVDVRNGTPDARDSMAAQIAGTLQALPWLTSVGTDGGGHAAESHCDSCGSTPIAADPAQAPAASAATLLNDDAISGLAALARAVCGDSAATAVHRLTAAARAAERHLPAAPSANESSSGTVPGATEPFDSAFWSHLTATVDLDAGSPCHSTLLRLSEEDLMNNAAPTGMQANTTGIQRVDVPDPCGPAPRMTIHGSGFGARQPVNTNVIAATWDTSISNSQLTYGNVVTLSWDDDTIVVQLPSTVVSGYAAFSDLQFVQTYNAWVTNRNNRVTVAMHANGCPGRWIVEVPLSLYPPTDAVAAYRAGPPVLIAQVSASAGPTRLFDDQTVYLSPGGTFVIRWQVTGADTLTLRANTDDDTAGEILTAAGYPATGATLAPTDDYLTLTAPNTRASATFVLEADNGCGTVVAEVSLLVAGPAVAPVTMSIIQSLPAVSDVALSTNGGTETLNPSTGNAIPLVAGKRTVVRIDWSGATEQLDDGFNFTAQASVHVTGDMLPFGGAHVPVCLSTADADPSVEPVVVLSSGPGFDSPAAYQQWMAVNGWEQSFYAVLPPEICLGGTISSTGRPALTAVSATITVTSPSGVLNWTLTAGVEVTFHQRRRVTLRYVPFGSTDPSQAPSDYDCETALKVAGSMLPVPDPEIYRLPGPALNAADGHLVEGLEAQRTAQQGAFSDATWRDEIWFVMGGAGGVNLMEYCVASSIDEVTCAHEIGHSYFQNHLDVCGGVPFGDLMSTWPDDGYLSVEGWNLWHDVDVETTPRRIDMMAYGYCKGSPGWIHPERWRRIFLKAGPPT